MANTRSARKRILTSQRRYQVNVAYRSQAKTMIKKAEHAILHDERDVSLEAVRQAVRTLDKAASKGILHKNNAARRKSRLLKKFNMVYLAPSTESV
ncbi:MAG: 30S ribosomal protein S20 [Chloroflexaceae bacterium]|nr:30S ribosomal protein S20 [Chloroflexaceae bacterium]